MTDALQVLGGLTVVWGIVAAFGATLVAIQFFAGRK